MTYLKGIFFFIFYIGREYLKDFTFYILFLMRKGVRYTIMPIFLVWVGICFFPDSASHFYALTDKNLPGAGKAIRHTDSFLTKYIFRGYFSSLYISPVRHYEYVVREKNGYNDFVRNLLGKMSIDLKWVNGYLVPVSSPGSSDMQPWEALPAPGAFYFPAGLSRKADSVKALYLSGGSATRKMLPGYVRFAKSQKLDGIVFDIKDVYGFVNYVSNIPEVKKTQGKIAPPIRDLKGTISYLHKNGLYAIARVTLFQDELFARHFPKSRITLKGGSPLLTKGRAIWVDPHKNQVRNYNLAIIRETLQAGADEIQLDYVRYPAEGDWKLASYSGIKNHFEKPLVISSYLQQIHGLTISYGAKLSLDVFGVVAWQEPLDIKSTGQNMKLLAQSADIISPMLYPSHFGNSFAGISNPANKPTHFIKEGCKRLRNIIPERVIIRPWLQAFGWRVSNYTPAYITDQIKGAKNAGINGYLLWNAGNKYQRFHDPLLGSLSQGE